MNATVATPTALASPAGTLEVYRDDGPLSRALGAAGGRALALPAELLAFAGTLPLFAAIVLAGDEASKGLVLAVVAWAVVLGGVSSGRPLTGRMRWAAPPLLRAADYAGALWIGAVAGEVDAAFAVIGVLAFRHYDLVYRGRHQAAAPPRWVGAAGLGWEGRLIAGAVLLALDALPVGYFVLAAFFAVVFVAESVASWKAFMATSRTVELQEDEEDEGQ